MKTLAILQSSYIPWKGYFDIIRSVDEFVLYDDVQFSKANWRNRNKILTPGGPCWLTIPVKTKGLFHQRICDTQVLDGSWALNHWKTISQFYARAPYFKILKPVFGNLYAKSRTLTSLSEINHLFLLEICALLGIDTKISWSMDYKVEGERSQRLCDICILAGATRYLSGPAAKSYLDEELFISRDVQVCWMNYEGYPAYNQLHTSTFIHEVSIIDLLFNVGAENALEYLSRNSKEAT